MVNMTQTKHLLVHLPPEKERGRSNEEGGSIRKTIWAYGFSVFCHGSIVKQRINMSDLYLGRKYDQNG